MSDTLSSVPDTAGSCSVFRVTVGGNASCFRSDTGLEFLAAGELLHCYLHQTAGAPAQSFRDMFPSAASLSPEDFEALAIRRMENTGEVAGAFDVNFDKREFSAVHIMNGWTSFALGDVSAAAACAALESGLTEEDRLTIFLDRLAGRELTSPGHLSARCVSFTDEIAEMGGQLNFLLEASFDVDETFGTLIETSEEDTLSIYANYDMARGEVCDTLDLALCREDGGEETLSYTLNAAEKELLRIEMDAYCRSRTGQSLEDFSRLLLGRDSAPRLGPQT